MYGETTYQGLRPGEASFLHELVSLLRAEGPSEAWDGKSDAELLAPLLHHAAPADEEPDPEEFLRIELFHAAVARVVTARTGVACGVMMRLHHDGHGRVVLLAGRLVAASRIVRDVTRFRFDGVDRLAEAGERLAAGAAELIERFPEVASLSG